MPSTDWRTSRLQTDLGLETTQNNFELQNCYGQDVWSEYDLKEPKIYGCAYVSEIYEYMNSMKENEHSAFETHLTHFL